jgi:AraC family transcriptional activator of pobA
MNTHKRRTIPQFALYGENTASHDLELVHIEDIYERSSRNGWVIKPHRHPHLFQMLCMFDGEVEMQLDTTMHHLEGAWAITLPPGVVHGFRFRPDTQGMVLSLAVNLQGLDAENQITRLLDGDLRQAQVLGLEAGSAEFSHLQHCLQAIHHEMITRREDQSLALFSLVKLVLVHIRRQVHQHNRDDPASNNGIRLTDRFRQLAEIHYDRHWSIAEYAGSLHVSVSTLNRACKVFLGIPAKHFLQERLHIEAKRRLLYTQESLEQLADGLGYKDAAYFSRVFKAREGMPPGDFRKAISRTAKT